MRKSSQRFMTGAAFLVISSTSVGAIMTNTKASAITEHSFITHSFNYAHSPAFLQSIQLANNSSGGFHPFKAIGNIIRGAIHAVSSGVKSLTRGAFHAVSSVARSVASSATSFITAPFKVLNAIGSTIHEATSIVGSLVDSIAGVASHIVSEALPISSDSVKGFIDGITHPFYTLTHPFHDFLWAIGGSVPDPASPDSDHLLGGLTFQPPGFLTSTILPDPGKIRLDFLDISGLFNLPIPFMEKHYTYGADSEYAGENQYYGTLNLAADLVDGLISGAASVPKAIISGIGTVAYHAAKGAITLGTDIVSHLLGLDSVSPAAKPTSPSTPVVPTKQQLFSVIAPSNSKNIEEPIVPPAVSLLH